ncbi:MAG TPA: bifunctional oligoribonuclease/PAP phosphatase NrnA [bacterium]|nr:bifunctional oligoribonuclease/PAP phosphatase NrnA [bacterium]HPT29467.1 bifunctional oligoribonuclease/PAP phosphatase NrnA [bacterium]
MNTDIKPLLALAYQKIAQAKNILIVSHWHPDPDALSSIGVMIELAEANGQKYFAYAPEKEALAFSFLRHEEKVASQLPADFSLSNYDLMIVLDCGSPKRTGLADKIKELESSEKRKDLFIIELDHHPRTETFADLEIRVPSVSSTCELLYYFLKENDLKINKNLASLLLAGILTDTGNFLYPITSDSSIKISSELLEKGAQLPKILQNTARRQDLVSLKIWGLALKNLRINQKYNLGVTVLSQKELAEIIDPENTELVGHDVFGDVAGALSNLGGVKGVLLLRDNPDGLKGNWRSSDKTVNMNHLAQVFGGGGHPQASGFLIPGNITLSSFGSYRATL